MKELWVNPNFSRAKLALNGQPPEVIARLRVTGTLETPLPPATSTNSNKSLQGKLHAESHMLKVHAAQMAAECRKLVDEIAEAEKQGRRVKINESEISSCYRALLKTTGAITTLQALGVIHKGQESNGDRRYE